MSAILKALKKLEQEAAKSAEAPLPGSITGRPKRRSGSRVVPGLIVFTLCVFTGIGMLIYTQHTSVPESPTVLINDENPIPKKKIPLEKMSSKNKATAVNIIAQYKPAAAPEVEFLTAGPPIADKQQADAKKGVQKLPDAQSHKIPPKNATDLPDSDHISAPAKPADPFSPIAPGVPGSVNEDNGPVETTPEAATPVQQDAVAEKPTAPDLPDAPENASLSKPVVKKTEPAIAVIQDASIDLQAISWSADPNKRLAIINGKICREKGQVAGYVVQSINSGDVVVSKGSVKGKLVFEIR